MVSWNLRQVIRYDLISYHH